MAFCKAIILAVTFSAPLWGVRYSETSLDFFDNAKWGFDVETKLYGDEYDSGNEENVEHNVNQSDRYWKALHTLFEADKRKKVEAAKLSQNAHVSKLILKEKEKHQEREKLSLESKSRKKVIKLEKNTIENSKKKEQKKRQISKKESKGAHGSIERFCTAVIEMPQVFVITATLDPALKEQRSYTQATVESAESAHALSILSEIERESEQVSIKTDSTIEEGQSNQEAPIWLENSVLNTANLAQHTTLLEQTRDLHRKRLMMTGEYSSGSDKTVLTKDFRTFSPDVQKAIPYGLVKKRKNSHSLTQEIQPLEIETCEESGQRLLTRS